MVSSRWTLVCMINPCVVRCYSLTRQANAHEDSRHDVSSLPDIFLSQARTWSLKHFSSLSFFLHPFVFQLIPLVNITLSFVWSLVLLSSSSCKTLSRSLVFNCLLPEPSSSISLFLSLSSLLFCRINFLSVTVCCLVVLMVEKTSLPLFSLSWIAKHNRNSSPPFFSLNM